MNECEVDLFIDGSSSTVPPAAATPTPDAAVVVAVSLKTVASVSDCSPTPTIASVTVVSGGGGAEVAKSTVAKSLPTDHHRSVLDSFFTLHRLALAASYVGNIKNSTSKLDCKYLLDD